MLASCIKNVQLPKIGKNHLEFITFEILFNIKLDSISTSSEKITKCFWVLKL